MEELLNKIQFFKRKIDQIKSEKAELEGRKAEILERMKKEFKVKTIEQAKRRLAFLEKSKASLEEEIREELEELERKLEGIEG